MQRCLILLFQLYGLDGDWIIVHWFNLNAAVLRFGLSNVDIPEDGSVFRNIHDLRRIRLTLLRYGEQHVEARGLTFDLGDRHIWQC